MLRRLHVRQLANSQGISLLEIILAVSIVMISLSALVVLANTASRNVAESRNHTIADQYVRSGIEGLRHIRDNDGWDTLLGVGESNDLDPDATQYYSFTTNGVLAYQSSTMAAAVCSDAAAKSSAYQIDDNGYYRVVKMSLNDAGSEATITVTVCYGYRGTSFHGNSAATTILTNWR